MPKARDWIKDVQGTDITFISNEGNHIKCSYEGFTFLVRRANWPPKRLTAEVCEDPTGFYVYQCQKVHGNKYDLSSVVYTKADSKIKVYCPVHGVLRFVRQLSRVVKAVECVVVSLVQIEIENPPKNL